MAKKKKKSDFNYIVAVVNEDDDLRFSWLLSKPGSKPGGQSHDEDVSSWSDDDIIKLAKHVAGVDEGDPVEVEVRREYK